ncbi:hypothetical protein Drose_14935 [Dactylosporangium roseum]|uniref:Condensation domain-containing protein n=1 Tax=Dactylosporangium roseum TaxID=47989 RepID=A0ABY5ZBD0_9ACTN|nr:condensation domain-containing protein [Dactylosporangium roseum]UWZ39415.1 hypothetical protein Drose_14935 [Dactylosporangium roseum]
MPGQRGGPARRLTVEFTGQRGGRAALTWAQGEIWEMIEQSRPRHSYYNTGHRFRVPAGRTVDDVRDAVRLLVETYEALRTTVGRGPDGGVLQHLHGHGVYRMDVVDTDAAHLGQVADEMWTDLLGHAFDESEWPVLFGLVTCAGRPAAVALVASHVALDWHGMGLVAEVFGRLLAGFDPPDPPGWQPFDQAAAEAAPQGRRRAQRSLAYWRGQLSTVPQTMFPVTAAPSGRLWPWVEMRSAALATASRILADRHRSTPGGVVLAATAALVGMRAGTPAVCLRMITGNRFAHQLRDMVGTCTQTALFVATLDNCPFGAFVDLAWAAMVQAYRYAQYPVPALRQVVADVSRERGMALDLGSFFDNLMDTGDPGEVAEPAATRESLAAALTRTTVRRGAVWPRRRRFNLEIRTASGGTELCLGVDPAVMSRAEAEQLLRAVDDLLVRAVHEDFPLDKVLELTGFPAPAREPTMVMVDRSWIDPDAIRDLLVTLPDVVGAEVTVDGRERLVADVVVPGTGITVDALHEDVLARLVARMAVRAPDHYRLRSGVGAPVYAEGTGRAG